MSNDRVAFYMRSQLLGCGFAIVDGQIAFALSGGVWPSITAAQLDFSKPQAVIDRFSAGCFIFNVVIEERAVAVIGATAEFGKNSTLRLFSGSQRSELPFFNFSVLAPNVIASQIDVFPTQRRQVLQ